MLSYTVLKENIKAKNINNVFFFFFFFFKIYITSIPPTTCSVLQYDI